jgi:hypothetical protein
MSSKIYIGIRQNFRLQVLKIFLIEERYFLWLLFCLILCAAFLYPYPHIAMWLAFMFSGYSAIANDSIQTLGTFISSNSKKPWWLLWLFISVIFVATMTYSWVTYKGDVTYERLNGKGFNVAPTSFTFLQLAAPLFLLLLTRMRMPVSTTFICLSVYSASLGGITSMLTKSILGYGVAFVSALVLWFVLAKLIVKFTKGEPHPFWTFLQWCISGCLWSVWLMQDGANIAVSLPRSLNLNQFLFFLAFITFGLGILFYLKGDKIQKVVTEKSHVEDVRSASIIDFTYTIILYFFKEVSHIPMSTTWVFLGLMGGRELAMTIRTSYKTHRKMKKTMKIIFKDLFYLLTGLTVSVILALLANHEIQEELSKRWFSQG